MTKKVTLTIVLTALVCLFLNGIVFSRLNIAGIRPDMIMAMTVSLGILIGSTRTQFICGGIGLLLDIIAGRFIGLNCAIYVIAGLVAGTFFRKFYTDNVVFPAFSAMILAFFRENMLALFSAISGTHFNYALMLVAYMIPCAIFTGVMCIPIYLIHKPLLSQYGRYISDKRQSLI